MNVITIIVAVLSTMTGVAAATSEMSAMDGVVGTWRLVEYSNYGTGEKLQPFGSEPLGYFIYSPSGHVSIHIMRNPPPDSFRDLDLKSEERRVLRQRSYVGYFGTYEVDVKRSVVIHRVEGGTMLSYIGTDQERPFRIEGDRLIIGRDGEWERILVRVPEE